MEQRYRHQCLIYRGAPAQQFPRIAAAIELKLRENYRCFYLHAPAVVAEMRAYLSTAGIDVENEIKKSRLILSSDPVVDTNGNFDSTAMLHGLEDMLDQALQDGHQGLFATGDMTWELGPEKNYHKLLEYEWRLEALFRKRSSLHGICQYHGDTLPAEVLRKGLLSHKSTFVDATHMHINAYYAPTEDYAAMAAKNPALDEVIDDLCQSRSER